MSNYWNLLCRTCEHVCPFGWNRGGDQIKQLIPHLQLLADCAVQLEPVRDILDYHLNWKIEFPTDLVEFARIHHAHDLIPIDEYGVLYAACGTGYSCGCCRTRLSCKKPNGHDGDHGPDEPNRLCVGGRDSDHGEKQ